MVEQLLLGGLLDLLQKGGQCVSIQIPMVSPHMLRVIVLAPHQSRTNVALDFPPLVQIHLMAAPILLLLEGLQTDLATKASNPRVDLCVMLF
jgi:hypothetical protein